MAKSKGYAGTALRQWASSSYSSTTGRAASSLGDDGDGGGSNGWTEHGDRQIDEASTGGKNGAPGLGWCTANRSQHKTGKHSA